MYTSIQLLYLPAALFKYLYFVNRDYVFDVFFFIWNHCECANKYMYDVTNLCLHRNFLFNNLTAKSKTYLANTS